MISLGELLGYVEEDAVYGEGGLLTKGQKILELDGNQVRETGGLFGSGEIVAEIDGSTVRGTGGLLTSGEVIAEVDGTEIRDEGGFWGAGEVLATVDAGASTRQKGAAAAAIALAYINEDTSNRGPTTSSPPSPSSTSSSSGASSSSKSIEQFHSDTPPAASARSILDACVNESEQVFEPPENPEEEIDIVVPTHKVNDAIEEGWRLERVYKEFDRHLTETGGPGIRDDVVRELDGRGIDYDIAEIERIINDVYAKQPEIPLCEEDREELARMFEVAKHISNDVDDTDSTEVTYVAILGSFNAVETRGPDFDATNPGKEVDIIESNDQEYIVNCPSKDELQKVTFGDINQFNSIRNGDNQFLMEVYEQYRGEVTLPDAGTDSRLTLGNALRVVVGLIVGVVGGSIVLTDVLGLANDGLLTWGLYLIIIVGTTYALVSGT